jgi:hypothetical protein
VNGASIVGVLGGRTAGRVDTRGQLNGDGVTLGWLIGAEDRWHDPRDDAAVRQSRLQPAPAYETRVRIPSGDAVQRVFATRGRDGAAYAVVEVENASPAPFAIAFVLQVATRGRTSVTLDETVVASGPQPILVLPRSPMRWSTATAFGGTHAPVTSGAAQEGAFTSVRGAEVEAAFIFPVAHRTTIRVALALDAANRSLSATLDELGSAAAVQRGWQAQLDRGMRVEVPEPLGERVDGARASALVESSAREVSPATIANLEDWGFDTEAGEAWQRASFAARRRARNRDAAPNVVDGTSTASDEQVLRATRDLLIAERSDAIELLPGYPPAWVGQSITVHDAPTRAGSVSFAVRWHGERPALLWDAPAGVTLRAPALDPSWSAPGGAGETLLAPWKAA